eukprot:g7310.t1
MAKAGATSLLAATMSLVVLIVGLAVVAAAAEQRLGGAHKLPHGMMMRRALTTSDTACASENLACADDTSCSTCAQVFVTSAAGCTDADELTCSEAQESFCCALTDEDEDCASNDTFAALVECVWEEANGGTGCDFDVSSDCSGATGLSSFWSVSTGLCSAAVAGLLATVFGVVG